MKHNWEYKKLGEICDMKSGSFINANELDESYTYPCFGGNGIRGKIQKYSHDGDLIIIGRVGALCGNVNNYNGKFYATEHAIVATPLIKYSSKWLYYTLLNKNLRQYAKGIAQPVISVGTLNKLEISIPDIYIQQRIVKELDEINEMIEGRKEQIKLLDQLAHSIFYEMFGDPITNPKGWEVKKLGKLCDSDLGKTLNSKTDTGKLYPYLCAINIQWNKIDTSILKQTKFEEEELERYTVKKGDLLVCEGGDVGRSAIWKSENNILYQNALHRLRFKGEIIPYFCLFVMKIFKDQGILDTKYSKGITIKHLVKSSLVSIPFPVPPIKFQEEFASKIEMIEEQKKDIENSIKELETLLASRMDYWFN